MKKKFFSLVLALAMVLPLCPALEIPVFAASGTTGSCTWSTSGTTLTISGNGAMADYYAEGAAGSKWTLAPWGEYDILKVVIKSGVTHIGDNAFAGMWINSVSIPSTVTSIGADAFFDTALSSVTIPGSVKEIGDGAFERSGCSEVTISSGVTTIGDYAFADCPALYSLVLPKTVTYIGDCAFGANFWERDSGIDVWYEGTKADREDMYIGDGNYLYWWVYNSCIKNTADEKVHKYSSSTDATCNVCGKTRTVFWSVSGSTLTISGSGAMDDYDWLSDSVYTPWSNYAIEKVVVKSGVTHIGDYAFAMLADWDNYGEATLKSVSLPSTLKSIGEGAFIYSEELNSITIPDSVTKIGRSAFASTGLTSVTLPDSVEYIDDSTFGSCEYLTSVTIPDSVTYIGYEAFDYCVSLSHVWYEGTSSDRNSIYIGSYNSDLTNATWHYNSCMKSTSSSKAHSYTNACDADCNYCGKTRTASPHTYDNACDTACNICGATRTITHTYSNACDTTCNVCGATRTAGAHAYTDACDTTCNICGVARTAPHSYTNECDTSCNLCGMTRTITHYTKTKVSSAAHTTKNDSAYPFTQSGGWTVSTNKTKSTTSTYTITAQHACTLTLNYKVSSEAGYDKMTVKKNSTTLDTISGEVEKSTTITLAKGDTVTVSYAKDGRTDGGNDCAYFKFSCTCASEQEVPSSTLSPTCTQGVVCSRCGITVKAATGHTYSNACDTSCNVCGATRTVGAHVYDNTCDETCNECGATRTVTHTYSNTCDTSCNVCGATRTVTHTYSNNCDTTCNVCGVTRTVGAHVYDNTCDETCNECGAKRSVTHTYDNTCDTACNICGATRTITHTYSNACDTSCNVCGATRTVGAHVYDNTCDETCNECGATRTVTHTYSNACDKTCNVCGATRTVPAHVYDGVCDETCNECGEKRSVTHTYDDDYDETCNVCGAVRSVVLALRTTLSKSVIDHGDTVVVSFSLSKPVSTRGFGLDYSAIYDKDAFEWVSGDWSEQIRTNSMLAQANPGTQAVFAGTTAFNVSGEIFTMTLRVKDGAKCGIQKIDAPQITQIQNVTLFGSEIKVNHVFDDAKDLVCNACGYERPPYTPGDVDDNGKVEMADAIHLLFHINFPTNYPVNQPVDFDGNGKVEMADAIYLLFHVNFPANYPLN